MEATTAQMTMQLPVQLPPPPVYAKTIVFNVSQYAPQDIVTNIDSRHEAVEIGEDTVITVFSRYRPGAQGRTSNWHVGSDASRRRLVGVAAQAMRNRPAWTAKQ
jgi:hypothetical protein